MSLKFSLAGALFVDVAPYGVERWLPAVYSKLGLEVRERFAFSLRPAFLYENSTLGLRVPLSVDLIFPMSEEKGHTISPYAGGGFALYDDGGYAFRPMVAGGVDLGFGGRFLVALGGDLLFKEADTDLELFMGLGYVFGKRAR